MDNIPLTSARQVSGPTIPSAAMGMAAWNPPTSRSVCGPKMPSMSTGGPSPSHRWARVRSVCQRLVRDGRVDGITSGPSATVVVDVPPSGVEAGVRH
jgi:hypothetical protein